MAALSELPFVDICLRLDAKDRPLYRSSEKPKAKLNQFVPDSLMPVMDSLESAIRAAFDHEGDGDQASLEMDGLRFHVIRQRMADGSIWANAKRIDTKVPRLDNLGFAPHIQNHLHQLGLREGLIVVSGSAGQGKTTTAAALVVDFLRTYGGTAFTIESPVEYVLKGRHGDFGQCFQMEVKDDQDWEAAIKQAIAWDPRYIFVGEVRTPKAAEALLRAASTGRTVITTVHAASPEETLMELLFMAEQAAGAGAVNMLAASITALVHQTMKDFGPFLRYLFTEENATSDPIRSLIREGKIGMLSTYIDRISARLANQPATGTPGALPPLAHAVSPLSPPLSPQGLPPLKK